MASSATVGKVPGGSAPTEDQKHALREAFGLVGYTTGPGGVVVFDPAVEAPVDANVRPSGASAIIDSTAAFITAAVTAKARGAAVDISGMTIYINSECFFDCGVIGKGTIRVGPSASIRLRVSDPDAVFVVDANFVSAGAGDAMQALYVESTTTDKKGTVYIRGSFSGFLKGVYGSYLKNFICFNATAQSVNTVPERYVEGHFACTQTDLFYVNGCISNGGVVGYISGAGVVREFYKNSISIGSTDHGFYSSSPTEKLVTVFDSIDAINSGGTGIKCFTNGKLFVKNPTVDGAVTGIICVGDGVYVSGGSVTNTSSDGIFHIGKEFGVGVNTFSELNIAGVHVSKCGGDGIKISGPESLDSIAIDNSTIKCAKSPVAVLTATIIQSIIVSNSRLESVSLTNDQVVENIVGVVGTLSLQNVDVVAGTTTANLIDTNSDAVILENVRYTAVSAGRTLRSRKALATIKIAGERTAGTYTTVRELGTGVLTIDKTSGSKTHAFGAIAAGATATTTVSVAGASVGMAAVASIPVALTGIVLSAEVTAANTVTVTATNPTSGSVTVASGKLLVQCFGVL